MLDKTFDIVATTQSGLEPLLKRELLEEGLFVEDTGVRLVRVIGDLATLYRINLRSRFALRFLVPVLSFHAKHPDEFYKKIRRFEWSEMMEPGETFAIDAVVNSPVFRNSRFMLYRCKDAIADHFVNKGLSRPSIDTENPTYRINLHIQDKKVNVSLDSSGESLHKRGYRKESHPAPMNEVLAAAMIDLAEWDVRKPLVDGMTGSGTIAIEAAMKMTNRAPGLLREKFGFMSWKNFDKDLFQKLKSETEARIVKPTATITAVDRDLGYIRMARDHARLAGVDDLIDFQTGDFLQHTPPTDPGYLFLNPPYGDRMDGDMDELYGAIGTRLKHDYPGWKAWIISGNHEAMKKIGLKPLKKYPLKNGAIDCTYRGYALFEGKRIDRLKNS